MKPRTKTERLVLELSTRLPQAPEGAWIKAQDRLPAAIWYKKNGHHKCVTCGHEWYTGKVDPALLINNLPEKCPHCGTEAVTHHYPHFPKYDINSNTIMVLTTCGEWQVIRFLKVTRTNHVGQMAWFEREELFQSWLSPDGREVIVGRDYTRSAFHYKYKDTWSIHHHNDSSTGYYSYSDMFDFSDARLLYRPVRLSDTVRRNGLTADKLHHCAGYTIYTIIRKVLTDPRIEHVAKRGTGSMLRLAAMITSERDFAETVWPAMRVALRHGYVIEDASSWRDMVRIQASFGCDIRSPRYVCPPDFLAEHDYWMRRDERRAALRRAEEERQAREREERKNAKLSALREEYAQTHACWQGVAWDVSGFHVLAYSTAEELRTEGDAMGHCVASYYHDYVQMTRHSGADVVKESIILSIRSGDGKRLETAEISPDGKTVLQCRASHNGKTPQHNQIIKALQAILPDIRRRMQEAKCVTR